VLFATDDEEVVESEATVRAREESRFDFAGESRRVGALREGRYVGRRDAGRVAREGHGAG
jgi:hypothetical protein